MVTESFLTRLAAGLPDTPPKSRKPPTTRHAANVGFIQPKCVLCGNQNKTVSYGEWYNDRGLQSGSICSLCFNNGEKKAK